MVRERLCFLLPPFVVFVARERVIFSSVAMAAFKIEEHICSVSGNGNGWENKTRE